MSKTEMLRQSAHDANSSRVEALAHQLQAVRQERVRSTQELAAALEPLTLALAALGQETHAALDELDRRNQQMGESSRLQLETLSRSLLSAMRAERHRMGWAITAGMASAAVTSMLVSAGWLWLFPPSIQNVLDPQALAQSLQPSLIQALKPSKAK